MSRPRVAPANPARMDPRNAQIARKYAGGRGLSGLPNVFATLGRHRELFAPYMAFAEKLAPNGTIPLAEVELIILRTAFNTDCEYEWHHHSRIAARIGIGEDDIRRVRQALESEGWTTHQRALLRAADELHSYRSLSDETWDLLHARYTDEQMIELCMLVGNYEMLAMVLKSVRVQIEP